MLQAQGVEVRPDYEGALDEFRTWMEYAPMSELARACVLVAEHRMNVTEHLQEKCFK